MYKVLSEFQFNADCNLQYNLMFFVECNSMCLSLIGGHTSKRKAKTSLVKFINLLLFCNCLHVQHNNAFVFHHFIIDVPGPPENLSVSFDGTTVSLLVTIVWQPPENLGQFDLDKYIVNISGMDISMQVPGNTTVLQVTDERMQKSRVTFSVTVTATNLCGQNGGATSTTVNVPSKTYVIGQA